MKASDFLVGSAVRLTDDYSVKGKVIGNTLRDGDQVVAIEWEDGSLQKVNIGDLKQYDSALEADYDKIKEMVSEATKLLKQANAIASYHKTDLESLYYTLGFSDFFQALNTAGWSSSSMRC